MRKRFLFQDFSEIYYQYRLEFFTYPIFFCNTSMILTDAEDLYLLKTDYLQMKAINPQCRFVVITEWTKFNMLSVLFPGAEFVRNDIPIRFSSIVTGFICRKQKYNLPELIEREEQYLNYFACGLKDEAIALTMNLSLRTVKRIKEGLMKKLHLNSANQLAVFAALGYKNSNSFRNDFSKQHDSESRTNSKKKRGRPTVEK